MVQYFPWFLGPERCGTSSVIFDLFFNRVGFAHPRKFTDTESVPGPIKPVTHVATFFCQFNAILAQTSV